MCLFDSMLGIFSVKIYFSDATIFFKYFFCLGSVWTPTILLNVTFHISCSNDAGAMIFCFVLQVFEVRCQKYIIPHSNYYARPCVSMSRDPERDA